MWLVWIVIILMLLIIMLLFICAKGYSYLHKSLEAEREEHDKYERLFKFMGKWMEAEEKGSVITGKIAGLNKRIVILGDNPIARVLTSKLDKVGIEYRNVKSVDECTGAEVVLVADISRYEKWKKKLLNLGIESISVEDLLYDVVV